MHASVGIFLEFLFETEMGSMQKILQAPYEKKKHHALGFSLGRTCYMLA